MPLMKSGSKKAMSKNISTEMHAGKPQKQAIAIAYSVMRRNKRKKMAEGGQVPEQGEMDMNPESKAFYQKMQDMQREKNLDIKDPNSYADGGMVQNEELNPRHEPGMGPQTGITRDSIQSPPNDNLKELYMDLRGDPTRPQPESDDQPHGMLGMDTKSIVANLRAKRDNYPRPDDRYRDPYKDDKYAEGGPVLPGSQSFQDAFRKSTHYAEGGEIDNLDSLSAHTEHLRNEEGLDDSQVNSQFMNDNSLSQDNAPMPEDLSRSSNMIQADDEDDQKKGRLDRIMGMLHSRHYGKK